MGLGDAIDSAGEGLRRTGERLGVTDYRPPSPEPELQDWRDKCRELQAALDPTGRCYITWYEVPVDTDNDGVDDHLQVMDVYYFNVYFYTRQIGVLNRNKSFKVAEKGRIELAKTTLEEFVATQEEKFGATEQEIQDTEVEQGAETHNHQAVKGGFFEEGDAGEVGQRQLAESAGRRVPVLPTKSHIYRVNVVDVRNPGAGVQYFEDVRRLISSYGKSIDAIETEIGEMDYRIEANTVYKLEAEKQLQIYRAFLATGVAPSK